MPDRDRPRNRERFNDRDQGFDRAWHVDDDDERRLAPREERAFGGYPDYRRDREAREEARNGRRRGPGAGHYGGQQPYAGQGPNEQGPYADRPQGRYERRDDGDEERRRDQEDLSRRASPHFAQGQYGQGQHGHEQGSRAERYGESFSGGYDEDRPDEEQAGRGDDEFDPDYRQWRSAQMRSLDEDYRAWRAEHSQRFADEFEDWRRRRRETRDNKDGAAAGSSGGGEEEQNS